MKLSQLEFARYLRSNQTDIEAILWFYIRAKRLNGIKFKRQVPIGKYIVDFVSYDKMVIIELDGGQHNESEYILRDKKRTEYLESLGFRVLRFWNNEVFNNIEGVLTVILEHCAPLPSPPPTGEGNI